MPSDLGASAEDDGRQSSDFSAGDRDTLRRMTRKGLLFAQYVSKHIENGEPMKFRRSVAVLVAACGLSVTGIAGAGAAQAVTPSAGPVAIAHALRGQEQLSLQQLLDLATHKVRGTYPNASLMLADGASPTGSTRNMEDVTDWGADSF